MRKNVVSAKISGFIVLILFIGGCGEDAEMGSVSGRDAPASTVQTAAPGSGEISDSGTSSSGSAQITADPEAIKRFLSEGKIPNGDIYLDGSTVHVNIAGLSPGIERSFAAEFTDGSYVLHDVKYTSQQLEAAYRLLDQDVHRRLDLYGSWIDVIQNKIGITMPDDNAAKVREELEKLIDPEMLKYDVSKIGKPHVTGEIAEIETGERKRILILEPGQEHPSYWFSISSRAKMYDSEGNIIKLSDLQKGQKVKLWSTGAVEDSFPALASLRRLELDRE